MKTFKIFIVLVVFLATQTACDNEFLEVDNPNAATSNQFWQNAGHAEQGIAATYSAMQAPWLMGGNGVSRRALQSDMTYPNPFERSLINIHIFNYTSADAYVENMWAALYTGIFRANQVLKFVPDIPMDEEDRAEILAEAHFLRALYYFWLTISYNNQNPGSIPLITEVPTSPDEIYTGLSSREDVYALIFSDLEVARAGLPDSWGADNAGRATWGAATTLLGKIHLYEGNWTEAATFLKEVIDSGIYSLIPGPEMINNANIEGEHNSESIFEVNFSDAVNEGTNPNSFDNSTNSESTGRARPWAPPNYGGFRIVLAHGQLAEILVSDPLDLTNPDILEREFSYRYEGSIATKQDETEYYNRPATEANTAQNYWGIFWKKFQNFTLDREDVVNGRSGINERIMRLADVYLMYAEALVERDGVVSEEALFNLNLVRQRAGVELKNNTTLATKEDFINHLMWVERPSEFMVEGFGIRWHDLRRRGLMMEAIMRVNDGTEYRNYNSATGTRERTNQDFEGQRLARYIPSEHDYLPLPSSEILNNLEIGF